MEELIKHYFVIAAGLFGLLIGSFLNVVAIRGLKGDSIVFPPSHCTVCQHRLMPWDLIPVLSFLWLRGRCRYCKGLISWWYPVTELVTALLFCVSAYIIGPQWEIVPVLLLISILVAIAQTDFKAMIIPNRIVYFGIAAAFVLRLWIHPLPMWHYWVGGLIGGGLLWLLAVIFKDGMGGGDIKLLCFIGLVIGWKMTLLTLFLGSIIGLVYSFIMLKGNIRKKHAIPFGPFLGAGAYISYHFGDLIVLSYIKIYEFIYI